MIQTMVLTLKAAAIAQIHTGDWYAYENVPFLNCYEDWTGGGHNVCLTKGLFDFVPPECSDYRESLVVL